MTISIANANGPSKCDRAIATRPPQRLFGRHFERRRHLKCQPQSYVQTKFSSAEGAITIIKEPLAAKMSALKRANKVLFSA